MADQESKITLTGEDKTGAMYKSAKKNADDYIKSLEKILQINESTKRAMEATRRSNHMTYQEQLENVLKHRKALDDAAAAARNAGKGAEEGANKQVTAAQKVNNAIQGVLKSHLSLIGAAEAARRSYLGFAESERKMIQLGNATKATKEALGESEAALRKAAQVTGTHFDEALESADKLRTGLNITLDEAIRRFPRLAVVAKGLRNTTSGDLAKVTTDFMRNMNIPATQFNETMEMLAGIVRETNIDMKDLVGTSGELGQMAQDAGYKGTDGIARLGVQLGIATDIMGDTSRGARLLMQTFGQASNLGQAMGIPNKIWAEQLDNIKKQGGDQQAYIVNLIKAMPLHEKEAFYRNIDVKQRLLLKKLEEENNGQIAKKIQLIRDLGNGQQAVIDGTKVMQATGGGVDSLSASIGLLADEFGRLMVTMGVPNIIAMVTKELQRLGSVVKWIGELIDLLNKGEYKKAALSFVGPHGFHPLAPLMNNQLGQATEGGLTGQQAVEDQKKALDEAIKKSEDVPPPGGVPPGWKPGDPLQFGPRGTGQLPGPAQRSSYGGSSDSLYLPADFRSNIHNASFGGGGGAASGGGYSQFSPGGPQGYGGGTSYGNQGLIPRTSGRTSSGRTSSSDSDETAAPAATAGGTAAGDYQGKRVNEDVMKTRIQQSNSEWMKDPKNQQKIFRTLQAEGGTGNIGANLEQMSNYAASRGLTLEQVVNARGKRQFYGPLKRFHGDPGSGPMMAHEREAYNSPWTDAKQKLWDKASKDVFSGGSNRINYATDQGTVGDPNYDPNKMTKYGANMFGVQPGTERWVGSQRGKTDVAGPVTVQPGGESTVATGSRVPRPGEAPVGTGNNVEEAQERVAGIRKGKLDPQLRDALEGAAEASGVKIRVTSGGQRMHGAEGHTGSHRHDKGRAADVDVIDPKTGKTLALNDPRRLKVIEEAARRGAGGTGARYMDDPNKIHMGITGAKAVVGEGLGAYAGTAEERAAVDRGLRTRLTPEQMRAEREARNAPKTPTAVAADEPKGEGAAQQAARDAPTKTVNKSDDEPIALAHGGPLGAGQMALVGERGPELFSPNQNGRVIPNHHMNASLNLRVNDSHLQFARASMRRAADREVREARWNSYSDIGAA